MMLSLVLIEGQHVSEERRPVSNTTSVRFTRGMSSVSLPFTPHRR